MNFAITWILGLFKKPEVEVTFNKADIKAWPFPVETKKKRPQVKKATTRKLAAKKIVKKAEKIVKKKAK